VSAAAALGGWVTAGIAAAMMIALRRMLGSRMEAVARACHELRGPLTAVRLGLSFGSRSGELSADRLRAIDTELGRAALALQDLGDLGGAGPRVRALERVDVLDLVFDCVRAADGLADERGVGMSRIWDGPPVSVWGDRLRLAQALGNLIANAIEHGGASGAPSHVGDTRGGAAEALGAVGAAEVPGAAGAVEVRGVVGAVEVRGVVGERVVRIEVCDGGPGLPAPIAQLTRRPRRGVGTRGRGLAIAAAIVETHGGRVSTAPAQRGARVVLELPIVSPGPAVRADG
jgi:signal transduction histidine kinase